MPHESQKVSETCGRLQGTDTHNCPCGFLVPERTRMARVRKVSRRELVSGLAAATSAAARCAFLATVIVAISAACSIRSGRLEAAEWAMGDPIVTYYGGGVLDDAAAQHAVEGGFNLVWIDRSPGHTSMMEQLDRAQAYGLRATIESYLLRPASLDGGPLQPQLDELIDAVKKHPATHSYKVSDEPKATEFAGLAALKDYINQRDPEHLVYINLPSNNYFSAEAYGLASVPDGTSFYGEYLKRYMSVVRPDLLSYDHYQLLTTGDEHLYFANLATIRQTAQHAGVPFMNIVQAVSIEDVNSTYIRRLPNTHELRFLAYTTLAYGAQAISYFNYWRFPDVSDGGIQPYPDGTPTSVYTAVQSINPQFLAIAKQVQPLTSGGAYHLGDQPPGTERLPGDSPFTLSPAVPDTTYLNRSIESAPVKGMLIGLFGPDTQLANSSRALVVNLDYINGVTTMVDGPGQLSVFDANTGTWTPKGQASAKLNLEPGGGVLVGLTSGVKQ